MTWEPFFAASKPRPVVGGLTTTSKRGAMAQTWWSRRFVEVLESYGLGGRMQRGRRYARTGQVMSLDISAGLIAAKVQGSRRTPYRVTVSITTPTPEQWSSIDAALAERIGLAAALLAGEVPMELEEAFAQAGAPLFPRRWSDLRAMCSCPDIANPCKHVAATLYVFADRLDADPWLVLEWLGRSRDDVLAAVGLAGTPGAAHDLPPWWPLTPGESPGRMTADALTEPPRTPDAVLRRLDELAVTAWQEPAAESIRLLYPAILAAPPQEEQA